MATRLPVPPAGATRPRLFSTDEERRRALVAVNASRPGLGDLYYFLIKSSWLQVFGFVAAIFILLNAVFGLAFMLTGGVVNARQGNFSDHFFFSVHTFGTIGYGSMYPGTVAAEMVMTAEALVSLFSTALVTGLAFAKFARPRSRVLWSKQAVVADRDGLPHLMVRVANERMNHVVEATIHVSILRPQRTLEGETVRRVIDLPLVRSSTPSFLLSWTVMHPITPSSPLYGVSPEELIATNSEMVLTLTGLDETMMQTIHARHSYAPEDLRYGFRHEDILTGSLPDGRRTIDYGRFHLLQPAKLTWASLGLPERGAVPPEAP